ncbi:hypothetical protein CPB83DRAFT_846458 [Crepidotus variabilis]|uniref:Uncharacterized protein n=1 Tax=Crepidotus variabilis TaxID=179855 RepID=A0A9P6EQH8_9AGAR|nr:hypothetical protein CPB83DRAFT_846458 [Crepidotus variabilis]
MQELKPPFLIVFQPFNSDLSMFSAFKVLFLAPALLCIVFAQSEKSLISKKPLAVPKTDFNVTSLGVQGNGCPAGSVYYTFNYELSTITINFSQFYAEVGPGIPISQNRKSCYLTIGTSVSPGLTFGLPSVGYRTYSPLDPNVTSNHTTIYYFEGQIIQATANSRLTGPIETPYKWQDDFHPLMAVVAPCGVPSNLYVATNVAVSNVKNPRGGVLTPDCEISCDYQIELNLELKKCPL